MTNRLFFLLIAFFLSYFSVAQEFDRSLMYKIGIGPGIEGNIGLIGLVFSNELSIDLSNRFSVNPSLTFFGTVRQWTMYDDGTPNNDHHSGFFTNITGQFDFIKTARNFNVGIGIGPSFEIGSSTFRTSGQFIDGRWTNFTYDVNHHKRMGYVTNLVFSWNHQKKISNSSLLVSMYSFDNYYGYFLMTTYRAGFRLKKSR